MSKQTRLGICTSSSGTCRIEFAESLARLQVGLALDSKLKVQESGLFYWTSSVIPQNRQKAVTKALEWGATHILFIDDDMAFTYDCIRHLLASRELDIIAANCVKRVYPTQFMSIGWDEKEVKTTAESTGIEEVMYTGNACIMIRAEVFKAMPKPWFNFHYIPDQDHFVTEDYYFQRKARDMGCRVYVDHDASKQIIHIGAHNFDYKASFQKGAIAL